MPEFCIPGYLWPACGEYEFVRVNLADTKKDGSPMPDFVLSKNIKLLMKIAALCNVEIDNLDGNETDVYEHVVSLFAGHAESPMTMKITETPNKKTRTTHTATMNSKSTSSRLKLLRRRIRLQSNRRLPILMKVTCHSNRQSIRQ